MASRLANSSSLYLQQHANSPVLWYEWGEEAWTKAKVENKPVFLSIGYSSCHWCHVMAHESFEDQEVATLLNEYFICIKLDREERPDIDETYMTAVQLATGHGGWPMSVFLTPEKKPFFAGTYFPKDSRQGQPGFLTIISSLGEAWKTQEDEIRKTSDEFASGLSEVLERRIFPKSKEIESGFLDQTVQTFHSEFDYENGGFGDQPKFPPHTQIRFLLNYATKRHLLPGDNQVVDNLMNEAAHMALFTLDKMASGGIHDHVGGGFHRYSTDDRWLLPHFEKMLYDNGQLLTAYSLGAESIEDKDIKSRLTQVQQKIISWINSEMILENGLIASAIDADSPEGEGYFYTWTQNDLTKLLSENSHLLSEYQISPDGNYLDELTQEQTGRNILYQLGHYSRPKELDILYKAREKREKPTKDNKSILAWNSLACSGLLNSGEHTPALKCLEIWWGYFEKGSLPHQIVNNTPEGQAFLDDAIYFCESLIDAWQATENDLWKTRANLLMDSILITFGHAQAGFNYTNIQAEILFGRTMPCLDQATPSPNGVAVRCLRRLSRREESLFHLAAILGWAQQLPTTCSTIIEECLEHLLLGEANVPLTSSGSNPEVEVSLGNQEPKVNETGFAETLLFIRIPNGYKINSHQPSANFLVPLSISIEGVYGEAAFAEEAETTLMGEIEIPIRLKKRSDSLVFSITVNYQLCSDTECYEPTAKTIEGRIQD